MNPVLQRLAETRDETIFRHTTVMMRERRISEETFALTVVQAYHARTPESARKVLFQTAGDQFACAKANAQKLFRYADGSARLPAFLEEAWVLSLDEPYRHRCLDDLAARYGQLAVPLPDSASATDAQSFGVMTGIFGEVMKSIAPALSDGKIDEADAPHVDTIKRNLRELLATAEGLLAQLEKESAAAGLGKP